MFHGPLLHSGKTDCSVCHSSTGVFCRACLKVRYGEGKSIGSPNNNSYIKSSFIFVK